MAFPLHHHLMGLTMVLALAACGKRAASDAPAPPPTAASRAEDPTTTTYAPSLNVDLTHMVHLPSGLYYADLKVGTGTRADNGSVVSVEYAGYLSDGTEFDASTTGSPYQFTLGQGEVVPGWDLGLVGMRVGGRRQLVIPSSLGYGDEGRPPRIPGGAIMVFTVDLIAVK